MQAISTKAVKLVKSEPPTIKTLFKTFPPQTDLPFLNNWRDKIIETALSLGIEIEAQRELIDFEHVFNEIKRISLERAKNPERENELKADISHSRYLNILKKIEENITNLKKSGYLDIVKKVTSLKKMINEKIKNVKI